MKPGQNRGSQEHTAAAFTLLELLTVVAILGILAALLLPGLKRGTAAARTICCLNNQKQLAAAWVLYANDNADHLAANGMFYPVSEATRGWVQGAFFYLLNTNTAQLSDPRYAQFATYIRDPNIYLCPTDRQTYTLPDGEQLPRARSYAMNSYLGWQGEWDTRLSPGYRVYRKLSDLANPKPADLFLIQDVNPDSICWPYFGVYMNGEVYFNFPNASHNRGGVISFADSHVEHHRWKDDRTIRARSVYYHNHYDAAGRNEDLRWLRSHTSVLGSSGYEGR